MPPAALIVVTYGLSWWFLRAPVAAGAVLLTLCAHRVVAASVGERPRGLRHVV